MAYKIELKKTSISEDEWKKICEGFFPKRIFDLVVCSEPVKGAEDIQEKILARIEPVFSSEQSNKTWLNSTEIMQLCFVGDDGVSPESVGRALTALGFGSKMQRTQKGGQIKKTYLCKLLA